MPEPTLFDKAVDNHSLFSDHFLEKRLKDDPAWKVDVGSAFARAKEIFEDEREGLEEANEAQTEERFIKPILKEILRWEYDVQVEAQQRGRRNVPDYALFASKEAFQEAKELPPGDEARFARTDAVADAKYWGRPLDQEKGTTSRDNLTNANPSFQIVNYMTATNLDWGILTNGARWRLYYAGARSRIDSFYEVNLEHILQNDAEDDFRWFLFFFRAAAFREDPQTGRSFLKRVYEGSVQYSKSLEDRLKDLIFSDVFQHLAEGFLAGMEKDDPTQEDLDDVYHGTLRLLYRLLFLLHAESRALLPISEPRGYFEYSLTRITQEVAEDIDSDRTLSTRSKDKWNDLKSLFEIIDRGDPALNVPRYNGGLFDKKNPANAFLNEHNIADQYLFPAIDKLARDADGHFVDYKALDVEQLGSIYEGLLEYRLKMEDGELFLENDKGERRLTGSYYTPHYIVEYIVQQTLSPVLKEREETFRKLMEEDIIPKRKKLEQRSAQRGPTTIGLEKQLKPLEEQAAETLLGIKVCDPAMGSGHFLVYTVDYLTEQFIAILNDYPENPVLRRLANIRARIIKELEEQGIDVELERLGDTNLLKRMVMKRCIYGVDLNPMAVELARLSLWLDSFTVGAPLSFLNHHLKVGNSLVGEQVRNIEKQLETDLFGSAFTGMLQATELMQSVALNTDATFSDVEESAHKFADFEAGMVPYRRMLDLWTSQNFGNEAGATLLRDFSQQVREELKGHDILDDKQKALVEQAATLGKEKRFFHWELEFPEVFFDLRRSAWKVTPGFDAVVGNPPYGYRVTKDIDNFMERTQGKAESENIAEYFVEKCFEVLAQPFNWGMIIPKQVLHTPTWSDVRQVLHGGQIFTRTIIDVSEAFEEVLLEQVVVIGSEQSTDRIKVGYVSDNMIDDDYSISVSKLTNRAWPIYAYDELEATYEKINQCSIELGEISHIYFGAKNIKAKLTQSDGLPMIIGDNIIRYGFVGSLPCLPREYVTDSWEQRYLVKKLVVQRIVAHVTKPFPHIIVMAANDKEARLAFDTTTVVQLREGNYDQDYLLAVINSRYAAWYLHRFIYNLSTRTMDFRDGFADRLPMRKIPFITSESERKTAVDEAVAAYDELVTTPRIMLLQIDEEVTSVLRLVEDHLSADPERADVVHDLLAHLARAMTDLYRERQRLDKALDPFKFLEKGIAFGSFQEVFNEDIKCGQRLTDSVDLSAVHHDIDGLCLEADGGNWRLDIQLKKRDPADWSEWQKDGNQIVREWAPVYRFELSDEKARYYQHAFRALDAFTNAKSFPGGHTRTTEKKLRDAKVPAFDPAADLTGLVELSDERAAIQQSIDHTDALIDKIVYRLYGLSEEEIAIIEGNQA